MWLLETCFTDCSSFLKSLSNPTKTLHLQNIDYVHAFPPSKQGATEFSAKAGDAARLPDVCATPARRPGKCFSQLQTVRARKRPFLPHVLQRQN